MKRNLPPTASVAAPTDSAKLQAPAAARNSDALCTLLKTHAPHRGHALELASGTGQHVTAFAKALPGLQWHPSEIAPDRLESIGAYRAESGLPNIAPAVPLDATQPGWHRDVGAMDLIVVINLLHLISIPEAQTVISEASQSLTTSGVFILYGPFKRDGVLTSEGDARFDAQLRQSDPTIGYKNDSGVRHRLKACGLSSVTTVEMPANNLAFIAAR